MNEYVLDVLNYGEKTRSLFTTRTTTYYLTSMLIPRISRIYENKRRWKMSLRKNKRYEWIKVNPFPTIIYLLLVCGLHKHNSLCSPQGKQSFYVRSNNSKVHKSKEEH